MARKKHFSCIVETQPTFDRRSKVLQVERSAKLFSISFSIRYRKIRERKVFSKKIATFAPIVKNDII